MSFDISHLLEEWEYQPGQVIVRRFPGKDGQEKIQLRVDLGLLQMNAEGRPDGKRPYGHPSLLEHFNEKLEKFRRKHDGDDAEFALEAEDATRLQMEALQYHHRCICLLQLEDYAGVIRDTNRNLKALDFVDEYADSDELSWSLNQFRPQVLMLRTRALAMQRLKKNNYAGAIEQIEGGMQAIRQFYDEFNRHDLLEQSAELAALEQWLDDINEQRPLSRREKLEMDLNDAVKREDYEKAARVRDMIRKLDAEKKT